jgi:outer membrane immunogenic protein
MKRLLVAGIVAAAFCSAPALAADMPVKAPMAEPFNWSGFYIGVNGGGMDFKTTGDFPNATNSWATPRKELGMGGIHGGFQGQSGNFVLGIEGAWDAMLGDGFGAVVGAPGAGCNLAAPFGCQARINDIISVGPRLGFAMGQWMIYGTGGYARAEIETHDFNFTTGTNFDTASNHQNGWYWGGGLEMLATRNFIVGVEYKHYDFQTTLQSSSTAFVANRNVKADADAALLRLTIKQ